jgi:hypothetical protein
MHPLISHRKPYRVEKLLLLFTFSLPWNALNETLAEVVECDSDLHELVEAVLGVAAEKHHLVVLCEVVVGDCDGSGGFGDVHQAVGAVGEEVVVDPNVVRSVDGDGVSVSFASISEAVGAASDHGGACLLDVVDVDAVDDDVVDVLDGNGSASGDVDVDATAVDGLEAVHDELVLQLDVHVAGEYDPERLILQCAIAERSRCGVDDVVVAVICHDVDFPILAADGVLPEPHSAVCKPLPVRPPMRIAPPAIVNRVACSASREHSSGVVVAGSKKKVTAS